MTRSVLTAATFAVVATLATSQPAQGQVLDIPDEGQHVVVVGNTLWDLAAFFYGDPFQWPRIYEANTDRIEDPHWIYPGQLILIPDEDGNVTEVMVVPGEPMEELPPQPVEPVVTYREPERTKFFRDTANVERAAREALERWTAVPQSIFYSAPFLDFTNGEQATGSLLRFEGEEEIRTPREGTFLYDRVILELEGDMPVPGTRLQVFKLAPLREGLVGLVATPTGIVTVMHRTEGGVVASVNVQYDRMLIGDLVRPLPRYTGETGAVAQQVTQGPTAEVVAYHRDHELHQPGNYFFLDMGRRDGLTLGDEFVVIPDNAEALVEGRAQVVSVQDDVATARIVMIRNPVFVERAQLRLDRKMPAR